MKKKLISVLIIIAMILLLISCSKAENTGSGGSSESANSSVSMLENNDIKKEYIDPTESLPVYASDDKYRNFYEIFVYSFCDSNGDGIGDINGIISKLDYLNDGDPNSGNDLGIDGIWLMPIMPSSTYHKYDVIDYYDIDPDYGTLDDFKRLIEECHKRGIKLIIDLVLNHCSSENKLFLDMCSQLKENKLDQNAEMFSIGKGENVPKNCYRIDGTDYFYEANFDIGMPEFNLSSEKTRAEFKKIMKFWLDLGVDGFRLDAVKYYDGLTKECSDSTDGVEFLTWLCDTGREINPDVYFVGELWDSNAKVKKYYESGIDSIFYYDASGSSGKFVSFVRGGSGTNILNSMERFWDSVEERNENAINALFLSNHDNVRSAGYVAEDLAKEKMLASSYMLLPGNSFIYYGEELGMTSKADDPSKRTQMIWSKDEAVTITVPGTDGENIPKNGGVKEQLDDKNSLLNFYRRIIKIKNQNPAIARGEIDEIFNFGDAQITAYSIEYDDEKNDDEVYIIHNFSDRESKTLDLSKFDIKASEIVGDLIAFDFEKNSDYNGVNFAELSASKLTLPPQSTVILK